MQVLFAGGAGEPCSGSKTPASNSSYLVNLAPGANHDLVTEEMGFARIVSRLFVFLFLSSLLLLSFQASLQCKPGSATQHATRWHCCNCMHSEVAAGSAVIKNVTAAMLHAHAWAQLTL